MYHVHMRTTLIIDDALFVRAQKLCGLAEKTAVIHAGLRALIARESALRLARLGGSDPGAQAPRRRSHALNIKLRRVLRFR
jgi:Arc/MetJ family transcription regulator